MRVGLEEERNVWMSVENERNERDMAFSNQPRDLLPRSYGPDSYTVSSLMLHRCVTENVTNIRTDC